jgi:archaellum biogenesis ATPase FlaH
VGSVKAYSLTDFDSIPSAKELVADQVDLNALPTTERVRAEASWTPDMMELFERSREQVEDRSSAMSRMAYSGAEQGWTDEQIAAVLYDLDDRWGKYIARRKETRDNIVLNFINRARAKYGYGFKDIEIDLSKLLRDPSVKTVDGTIDKGSQLIFGFQEFVEADFHIDWMFEGLLAQGGIGLITASPGTGKTQLALQLGAYQALGHDRFLKWDNKVGTRKVLFLSLEMSKPPLNLFMSTIGQSYPDKTTLNRNFQVLPFGKPLPLDTEKGQAFLNTVMDETQPDLLIIDSLQRSISKEMTDELAAKNLMHYLAVMREKYRCAVVMIHHNRKKSAEAKKSDISTLDDVYGSVFFTADVDFILSMNKHGDEGNISLHTVKNRLGRETAPFEILRDEFLHFSSEFENVGMNIPTQKLGGTLDVG